MKKRDKYLIVVMMFLITMIVILLYFYRRYNSSELLMNGAKDLLKDLYTLKEGKYELKNGALYNYNNEKINDKFYLEATGIIYIDKYFNVKFNLNSNNNCINKTSLGNIKIEKNSCSDFKEINVNIIKNNSNVSFESDESLEYMISNKDDFKGIWKKQEDNKNIIIKSYNEGINYIWFKDKNGNLSKTYSFKIDCLNTSNAKYNSNIFYCSGSTVILDEIKWVVIKDNNSSIELMKFLPLDQKFEFNDNQSEFKWSTSQINNYLNNEFINELSISTVNKLLTNEICDDYYNIYCDGEVCGGRSREEIEMNNYICSTYTNSKVKIISYNEYNYVFSKSNNKNVLNGNYWSINSFELGKGTSIQYNSDYYILENITNKLDVRPVIIVNK